MKRLIISSFTLAIVIAYAAGCGSSTDANGGDPPPPPPVKYTLSTEVVPSGAGTITPASGDFDEGSQQSIEALSNDGFEFDAWGGSIESEDNPLNFTMDSNKELTANFLDIRSTYSVNLIAADPENEIELEFGQADGASDGFDEGLDEYAPPAPPQGALHVWFESDGESYFTDYRNRNEKEVTWRLYLQPGEGSLIQLTWTPDIERAEGKLILTDADGSFELDMFAEDSYEVDADDVELLLIEYKL
ncbi:MAG: hypothetical protein EA390_02770 [Balneolaceae bacterium]|nr:MAG: hypothetical protein EA390_02770 [Balneolaceae bacterium]